VPIPRILTFPIILRRGSDDDNSTDPDWELSGRRDLGEEDDDDDDDDRGSDREGAEGSRKSHREDGWYDEL